MPQCPSCKKEIDGNASKCPYCHENIIWDPTVRGIFTIGKLIILGFLGYYLIKFIKILWF